MKKWIVRLAASFFGLIFFVVAVSAIALATYNPNKHKEEISAAVTRATGRNLVIAGDIGITLFPVLGFEAESVQLGNLPGFFEKDFLSAGRVSAGVKLVPLLSGNLEITKIIMQEPHINIIRQMDGTNNLQLTRARERAPEQTHTMNIRVGIIEIKDGSVTYTDKMAKRSYTVDPLNLTFPGFSKGENRNFHADMAIKEGASDSITAVDIKADINGDLSEGIYDFENLRGTMSMIPGPEAGSTKISFSGNAKADTRTEEVALNDLKATWLDSTATGKAVIRGFAKPAISFTLSLSKLDLDSLNKGRRADSGRDLLSVESLRGLTLDGDIRVAEIKSMNLTATNLDAKINGKNGLITIDPLRINAYEGTEKSRVVIDARTPVPEFSVTGNVENAKAGPMLKDYMGQDYVSGLLNANYNLTASGNTLRSLRETAAGIVDLSFSEGEIRKWELSKLLNQAIAFFETGKANASVSDSFRFTSLNATFKGSNGIFHNDDLVLVSPASHALGSGTVSLREQAVDYTIRAGLGEDRLKFDEAKHLPIVIRGPLNAPGYSLDFEAIAVQALHEKIEEKTDEIMKNTLEGFSAQEPAAGDEQKENSSGEFLKGLLRSQ